MNKRSFEIFFLFEPSLKMLHSFFSVKQSVQDKILAEEGKREKRSIDNLAKNQFAEVWYFLIPFDGIPGYFYAADFDNITSLLR